ncbi:UdgX family uracil-DNA binding protein [Salinibacterium sp. SYSU T00001]|uniref:UdgX family uracil-DNA binding protein n=1 Tax=Homoserinimonas sedimenticola TaxID=2986805 RepID=UPI0022354742|nr:UdgX family uracil-DNA binding protein [Salinibacterium sedimenticola]MCW4384566.1 UdgX family uracil-DNA binding protein [Salinibacterium sedimenticola]
MADVERPGAQEWVPDGAGLEELRSASAECRGCELWKDAEQVVFSAGQRGARIMLVGEQPGDQEDRTGEPFIGPAGRVLDDALADAGIPRGEAYVTNAVKHFRHHVRGKRRIHDKPGVAHIEACHPWLDAEMRVISPAVVVALGATAGRALLGRPVRITAERGALTEGPQGARVLITTHPSALLRLRGREGWDEAYDRLVADLEIARDAARA